MPTKQELIDALRRAHAAGDIQATNELAAFIDAAQFDEPDVETTPELGTLTPEQYAERFGDAPDIEGYMAPDKPKPEPSIGEKAIGAGESALTTFTGATGGTLGMLGGTLRGLAEEIRSGEFGTQDAADRIENFAAKMASEFTYSPRTKAGQEYVETIGEVGQAAAPLAGLGGELAMIGQAARTGSAPASAAAAAKAGRENLGQVAKDIFSYQTPTKKKIAEMLENYASDVDTVDWRLSAPSSDAPVQSRLLRSIGVGASRIKEDKIAQAAVAQGLDKGVVAMIKGASPTDKAAMGRMLDIYQRGEKDALFRVKNRPSSVVGERLVDAYMNIRSVNRKAGRDIESAARSLRGKPIKSSNIGDELINDLSDMGVSILDDLKLDFRGSDIEGVAGAENAIRRVFNRMTGPEVPDAYELHRLKRFIDEQVSYGKQAEGLTARSERMLKGLRRKIDKTLDDNFPDYKEANDIYAETIDALDTMQSAAGKKVDLTGDNAREQIGTLMRRALSNAQSRAAVIDMAEKVDYVSRKYPERFMIEGRSRGRKPDIMSLVMFSDELDSRFGPTARTSLQGQAEQVAGRARGIAQANSPTMALADEAVGAAARGIDKMRGVSNDKAMAALKALIEEDYAVE